LIAQRLLALSLCAATTATQAAGCAVAVDVGHSVQRPGATSARGVGEWKFNVALAHQVDDALTRAGIRAMLLNPQGNEISLPERPAAALKAGATLLVSLHHDSVQPRYLSRWEWGRREQSFSDLFKGYGLFVSARNPAMSESLAVAAAIGDAMLASGLRPSLHHSEQIPGEGRPLLDSARGVYQYDDLVVLAKATMPAVLIEAGVIVNRDEELDVASPKRQAVLASAVVAAATGHCARLASSGK
jgi:N-acetylmuramoyl-L-alanine amidase